LLQLKPGAAPPARTQVDGTVFTFQPLSDQTVLVLGTDYG